ncbi:hypothetical protein GALMADRAFT_231126 [Galerina marginata CBS 339.88]|uniref:Mid2 domain-containing protein n=1 Tax=Galerina marginata (strain CBS 339.88) TaxID=685588 RepID=A0A067SFL9_GALM3|nr:hypothetical protein GALMADRAFT_231126 [Galerina marginata CBS 339.88]
MYFSVVVIAIALLYADAANAVDHLIRVGAISAPPLDINLVATSRNPFSSSSSTSALLVDTAPASQAVTTTASSPTSVVSTTVSTPKPPDPSPTPAPSGGSNRPSTNKSRDIGPIVGGIVGGLMLIAIATVICIYQQRRKRQHKRVNLDLAAESDNPLVVPFRSTPFRTIKRPPPSHTDTIPRMVMHEDSGIRMLPTGEHVYVPVVDVPPRYTPS